MPWADVITDQPGASMDSQAWSKCDVTRLHTKGEVKVKSNTLMHQAITRGCLQNDFTKVQIKFISEEIPKGEMYKFKGYSYSPKCQ